ncbi:MAG: VWA domain-containing protein [Terriglobia bacterium]
MLLIFAAVLPGSAARAKAQNIETSTEVLHRTVNLVQLDVAVTDKKGNYVSGLRPWNFKIYEDGIPEEVTFFAAENGPLRRVADFTPGAGKPMVVEPQRAVASRSVFMLFDTSNYMYRDFVFAQDAIAEFVRSLDPLDRVAFYSYSRDFSRGALLTASRSVVLHGVRATVAGDDAALYDSMLMTLEDASRFTGRRVVVVFSNGPDNSSMVAPENVLEFAQSKGIPIYMICTQQAKLDPISTAVFDRISAGTGGKAYFAKNWEEQQKAFGSVREDLAHLYSLSYYPRVNPNRGWRKVTVQLAGVRLKKYHIRTRTGYRPQPVNLAGDTIPPPLSIDPHP